MLTAYLKLLQQRLELAEKLLEEFQKKLKSAKADFKSKPRGAVSLGVFENAKSVRTLRVRNWSKRGQRKWYAN
jgi:hypothetical protein